MIKIGVCNFILSRFDAKRLNHGIKYSWKKRNLHLANCFVYLRWYCVTEYMCNIYRWWDQIPYSSFVNWLTNFNSNKSTYCDSSRAQKSSSCQQSYSWCLRECTCYWVIWPSVLSLALMCFMLFNLCFLFQRKV